MPYTIVLHIINSEPVMGETEQLPSPSDTMVMINNPRMIDGKELHYLAENVASVYWPVERLNFIEVLHSEVEEPIIGFVRE